MIDDFHLEQIVEPLQKWFYSHARVLPWREDPRPYYVWVSEIMLQQTRVEAVKGYFERFITALPDVKALAECPENQYLKLWEGLGYYNRVRNLNAAAIQIMEEYDGVIPDSYDELLKLKGIGHYTAGAIASIAYGKAVPAVDGNVLRVISRVTCDDSDIMKQSVRNHMEAKLFELMKSYNACKAPQEQALENAQRPDVLVPRAFNQALMELGAMVCVPNGAPHCEECPWHIICEARKQNRIAEIPVKKKAKSRRIEDMTVLVIRDDDKVAVHKRGKKGLLAGLYELPNLPGHLEQEEILSYIKELGYSPIRIQPLAEAKHIFSHVEWNMTGYVISVEEPGSEANLVAEECDFKKKNETVHRELENDFIFVDAEDAREQYAIPAAFSYYAQYMNIRIGKEAFMEKEE